MDPEGKSRRTFFDHAVFWAAIISIAFNVLSIPIVVHQLYDLEQSIFGDPVPSSVELSPMPATNLPTVTSFPNVDHHSTAWDDLNAMITDFGSIETLVPDAGPLEWPTVHIWDYAFAVDYYVQGDDDDPKLRTEWHLCATTHTRWAQELCPQSPEYRRTHHKHGRDWRG